MQIVEAELTSRLAMDKPPVRTGTKDAPGYDEILAKFYNPFELSALVESQGFTNLRYRWYNFHVTPPMLSGAAGKDFRTAGIELEGTDDWRIRFGSRPRMFMCGCEFKLCAG